MKRAPSALVACLLATAAPTVCHAADDLHARALAAGYKSAFLCSDLFIAGLSEADASLSERFGHVVVEAAGYSEREAGEIARRVRIQRASVVLNLDGIEVEAQLWSDSTRTASGRTWCSAIRSNCADHR